MNPDVDKALKAALDALKSGKTVQVRGSIGSGRRTLAARLQTELGERAVFVDLLPPREIDAAASAWLQASVSTDVHEGPTRSSLEVTRAHAAKIAGALADAGKVLVILLPTMEGALDDEEAERQSRVRAVLEGLRQASRRVELGSPGVPASLGNVVIDLPEHALRLADLDGFGVYAPHAAALKKVLGAERVLPLVLRLAVGNVAWGMSAAEAAELCRRPAADALGLLLRRLVAEASKVQPVLQALRRLSLVRRPIPRAELLSFARVPTEHEPLLTGVIGYGDETITVSPPARRLLKEELDEGSIEAEPQHAELAGVYARADGALDPFQISEPSRMVAWLEKQHHLANGGEQTRTEWEKQKHVDPWLWWGRARALSLSRHFAAAATVYKSGLSLFPKDDYGWHYLAFNLDRAGTPEEVPAAFKTAIEIEPTHQWWNSRYVCWLIRNGRYAQARKEWSEALRRVDSDGSLANEIADAFHYYVAQQWMERSHVSDARRVLEPLSPGLVAASRTRELRERIRDTEKEFKEFVDGASSMKTDAVATKLRGVWSAMREQFGDMLPLPSVQLDLPDEDALLEFDDHDCRVSISIKEGAAPFAWYARFRPTSESGASKQRLANVSELMAALTPWMRKLCDGRS